MSEEYINSFFGINNKRANKLILLCFQYTKDSEDIVSIFEKINKNYTLSEAERQYCFFIVGRIIGKYDTVELLEN